MKLKFNKVIALLTVLIMTITLFAPMSAAAAGSDAKEAGAEEESGRPETLDRGKIKILEVYPNEIKEKNADITKKDVYSRLVKGKTNSPYSVTTISINKLISLKDEINGKYDVVYFNGGNYTRNAPDEYNYGSDITKLTAGKLEKFIQSGQLCIFHEDVFNNGKQGDMYNTVLKEYFSKYRNNPRYPNFITVNNSTKGAVIDSLQTLYKNTSNGINPRPILQMTDYPATYNANNTGYVSNKLTFSFKVYDPNTPLDESLKVALYIDRNNDSLYEESEIVYPQGADGDKYTVTVLNGRSGTITFNMPQGLTGVYFWKLVVKDSQNATDEFESVFRLKGQEIKLRVLQIKPDANNGGNLSLIKQFNNKYDKTNNTYGYKQGEYKIEVTEKLVSEVNKEAAEGRFKLNGIYDMVIIGFNDNYTEKDTMDPSTYKGALGELAVKELRNFVNTKQSVMFTHDSIHFKHNRELTEEFADDVGQVFDNFEGVWTLGLAGSSLPADKVWVDPGDRAKKAKQIYDPDNHYQVINTYPDLATSVVPVNSSPLTLYPFVLEGGKYENYKERQVAKTHYQWYKLDLEDPEVIPLFNLYKDGNSKFNDDAMNNYYTYTKGTITFSGTGHSNEQYPDFETKLFVNTVIRAYSIANHAPEIEVFEPQDNSKIPVNTPVTLRFRVYDFDYGTEKVKYEVFVDKYNRGNDNDFVSISNGRKIEIENGKRETLEIEERYLPESGKFRIKIYAEDEHMASSYQVLTVERVNSPMITPKIEILDMEGNSVDKVLVNETVKVKMDFAVTGNTDTRKEVQPKFSLSGEYLGEGENSYISNETLGRVVFSRNRPDPESFTKWQEITINPLSEGETTLNLKVKVSESTRLIDPKETSDSVDIRKGQVEFRVTDFSNNPIKNAKIKDMDTGAVIGTTNDAGYFIVQGVVGAKNYEIEAPSGYTYIPGSSSKIIYRVDDSENRIPETAINLTYDNYRWRVDFKVNFTLGMTIDYYKLNLNKTNISAIGSAEANNIVKNTKNTPITIVAVVDIQPLASGELRGVDFEIVTEDKYGVRVGSGDLLAVISNGSGELSSIAALNGYTQMNESNSIEAGSYAGQKYYLVINAAKTDGQVIKISKVKLTSTSPSGSQMTREITFPGSIKIEETTTPLLR